MSLVSEVKHVGTFVSGEQIFFSKYYSAVVFDSMAGNVAEKSPEQLRPGDVLCLLSVMITPRILLTSSMSVCFVMDVWGKAQLRLTKSLNIGKKPCREYKETNGFTYRKVAQKMREAGSSMQEVTIRQWLIDDSHIVGPVKNVPWSILQS